MIIHVDQNSVHASDTSKGLENNPLKSISKAAQIAMPGDVVLVNNGIYREWVQPLNSGTREAPIVYKAKNRHQVVIRGSKVYEGRWGRQEGGNCYATDYDDAFFEGYHPFEINRQAKFPDFVDSVTRYSLAQVFVDGQLYHQVLDVETLNASPQSWFKPQGEKRLCIHMPQAEEPESSEIEISVRPRIFAPLKRGLGYIEVKGFVMEHCANQYPRHFWEEIETAQAGALGCGAGHHWVITDNIVRYANTIGIDCGSESSRALHGCPTPPLERVGYHTIKNNVVEHNGCTGIAGWGHMGTEVSGNTIRQNNRLGILSWETAGIKFHDFRDGVIEDNLIEGNDAWGIWLDNVYKGSAIRSNLMINNLWGGIFFEMGSGPCYVTNNVIANSISGHEALHRGGHGIYGHDAAGVKVYHNLFYCNSGFGVTARVVVDRPGGDYNPCEASDWDIRNNLFMGNRLGHIEFTVPMERARNNHSDHNLFMNGGANDYKGTFTLCKAVTATLQCHPDFVVDYLEKQIEEKGLSGKERPRITTRDDIPFLTFAQWQAILGHDLNSRLLPRNRLVSIRQKCYQFQALPETGIYSHTFKPLEAVPCDYFGNPINSKPVYAGPFQGDFEKQILIQMWPKSTN